MFLSSPVFGQDLLGPSDQQIRMKGTSPASHHWRSLTKPNIIKPLSVNSACHPNQRNNRPFPPHVSSPPPHPRRPPKLFARFHDARITSREKKCSSGGTQRFAALLLNEKLLDARGTCFPNSPWKKRNAVRMMLIRSTGIDPVHFRHFAGGVGVCGGGGARVNPGHLCFLLGFSGIFQTAAFDYSQRGLPQYGHEIASAASIGAHGASTRATRTHGRTCT